MEDLRTRAPRALSALAAALLIALSATAPLTAQVDRPDPVLETAEWNGLEVVAGRLLVGYDAGLSRADQLTLEAAAGLSRSVELRDDLAVLSAADDRGIDTLLAGLDGRAGVAYVEPDVLMQPSGVTNDPKWGQQWSLSVVGAADAFDIARGRADVVIAVIDSGVKTNHADLAADYAWGDDPYAGDSNPNDTDGHGTHCSGVAAASTDNGTGIAGGGFDSRFAAYRCGNGSFPTSVLVDAIDDAVERGAQVLSMSWGSSYNSPSIRNALQRARDAGCVLVAAAGNDGHTTKSYPAGLGFVIAVASSSQVDTRSSFSNHGSWVAVAAPGQGIVSTYKNGGYTSMSGTSMATPLVAGQAGLLYAQLGGTRSTAAADSIRAAIQDSAVPVGSWVTHGRVDFPASLAALADAEMAAPVALSPPDLSPLPGQTVTLTGSGLLGTTAVFVDGQAADDVQVLDDGTLTFALPELPSLGTLSVVVHEGAQVSAPLGLVVQAAAPPELGHPATIDPGDTLRLDWAGQPGHQAVLLLAAAPDTFGFAGSQLLLHHVPLPVGTLDALGLGDLSATIPASLADVTLYLQVATLSAGLSGASDIGSLVIRP